MDWDDVREMPFSHDHYVETRQEVDDVIYYCMNDVDSTLALYKHTIGKTDHPLYKGIDKLALRGDIYEEFKIKCFNFNDVKIGEQLIKKSYMESTNIDASTLRNLPKDDITFTFGDCFPDYYKFKTPHFNKFIDSIKDEVIRPGDKDQSFNFKANYLSLTIAKGGLHSNDEPRWFTSNEKYKLIDEDVGLNWSK